MKVTIVHDQIDELMIIDNWFQKPLPRIGEGIVINHQVYTVQYLSHDFDDGSVEISVLHCELGG